MPPAEVSLDPIVPSQFFIRRDALAQPEKRLLAAVLEDAVRTFQSLHDAQRFRGKRLFREVETWLASDRAEDLFDYACICQVLGIDAGWLRAGLWRWRAEHEKRSPMPEPVIATSMKRSAA